MDTIGFIGCGNMGGAIAKAVCRAVPPETVLLANRTPAKAQALAAQLGCRTGDNAAAAACDWVFLGVKPQMMADMLADVRPALAAHPADRPPVLVSMAAGLTMAAIREMAGGDWPVIRILPNTPAGIGAGMTLYCTSGVSPAQQEAFLAMMAPSGRMDAIDEGLCDVAGCLTGCGPAWAYQFIEALADGAVACGLPRARAMEYAAQMLVGAGRMVLESGQHPGALKDAVCSPGGSTIQGVRVLEQRAMRGAVIDAMTAAYEKTKDMGKAK